MDVVRDAAARRLDRALTVAAARHDRQLGRGGGLDDDAGATHGVGERATEAVRRGGGLRGGRGLGALALPVGRRGLWLLLVGRPVAPSHLEGAGGGQ